MTGSKANSYLCRSCLPKSPCRVFPPMFNCAHEVPANGLQGDCFARPNAVANFTSATSTTFTAGSGRAAVAANHCPTHRLEFEDRNVFEAVDRNLCEGGELSRPGTRH